MIKMSLSKTSNQCRKIIFFGLLHTTIANDVELFKSAYSDFAYQRFQADWLIMLMAHHIALMQ